MQERKNIVILHFIISLHIKHVHRGYVINTEDIIFIFLIYNFLKRIYYARGMPCVVSHCVRTASSTTYCSSSSIMDVEEQARAISAFGGKVFHGLFQSNNVAVSPLALGMVLMAATSGAEGDTKKELLDTFQISTLDLESCQSLIRYALLLIFSIIYTHNQLEHKLLLPSRQTKLVIPQSTNINSFTQELNKKSLYARHCYITLV